MPDTPSVRLAKAVATCADVMAVVAVKVKPPMVTELPAARELNVISVVSCEDAAPWIDDDSGTELAADTGKLGTAPEAVAVNKIALLPAEYAPEDHPVRVPEKVAETPLFA